MNRARGWVETAPAIPVAIAPSLHRATTGSARDRPTQSARNSEPIVASGASERQIIRSPGTENEEALASNPVTTDPAGHPLVSAPAPGALPIRVASS